MNSQGQNCPLKIWISSACAGAVVLVLLLLFGRPFLGAFFTAVIFAGLLGVLLTWLVCRPAERKRTAQPSEPVDPVALVSDAPAADPTPEPAADPTPAAPEAPKAAETATPGRPAALAAARESGADDLKKIKGVGPKLEQQLNELGLFHFDQIAAWTEAEVAWMDGNLKGFKGRVSRDDWVAQASLLATGGETEFSKKVDKGDVY